MVVLVIALCVLAMKVAAHRRGTSVRAMMRAWFSPAPVASSKYVVLARDEDDEEDEVIFTKK